MRSNTRRWVRGIGLLLVALAVLLSAGRAAAADFRSGETVIVEEGEVVDDDLFASGGQVLVEGTVTGDLFASGAEVVIDGVVEGSAFIGANTARVNGEVGGSVYAGLYSLALGEAATVGRNVYIGAFSFEGQPGSEIGRDLYAGTYQTIVDGAVAGDVVAESAALRLGGEVGGDVQAEVAAAGEQAPPDFTTFMPDFGQEVTIIPPGLQVADDAVVGGEVAVTETQQVEEEEGVVDVLIDRLGELIALLLVGALWILVAPALLGRAGDALRLRPLPSAGIGCLTIVLFPLIFLIGLGLVIALVLVGGLVTAGQLTGELIGLGGAGFAFAVASFGFAFSILTKIVVAYLLGRLLLGRVAAPEEGGRGRHFGYLLLGAVLYELLRAIPYLGLLVAAVVIVLGLGALFLAARGRPTKAVLVESPAA